MTTRAPPSTRDWLRLLGRDARSPGAVALLKRFGASVDKMQWIHGAGRLAIPKAGVYLFLWKAGAGRQADVQVVGVQFSFGGMRRGKPYANPLPFKIAAGDSIDRVGTKLRPRQLIVADDSKTATAGDRMHRFVARFNSAGQLQSLSIVGSFEMRRIPRA